MSGLAAVVEFRIPLLGASRHMMLTTTRDGNCSHRTAGKYHIRWAQTLLGREGFLVATCGSVVFL